MHTQELVSVFGMSPDNACRITLPSGHVRFVFYMRVLAQKGIYAVNNGGYFATHFMSNGVNYE
jgi:hypothetical protein